MSTDQHRNRLLKAVATASIVFGLAAGSYGLASAATGSGSSSGSGTTNTQASTPSAAPNAAPPGGGAPCGDQRSDETLLTGHALSKETAIAQDKVPGGTIARVESDAGGVATYEAHVTKSDGTPVPVYVDANFNFVSVR